MAVVRGGSGDIGAHPLAAGFALRIDTLHGKAGHVLHLFSLSGRKAQVDSCMARSRSCRKESELPQSPKSCGVLCLDSGQDKSDPRSNDHQGRAGTEQLIARILPRESCGVKRKDYKILW